MPIRIRLDDVLAAKGMKARQVAAAIGVSETHLSLFRSGKVRGVALRRSRSFARRSSVSPAICSCTNRSDDDATAEDGEED